MEEVKKENSEYYKNINSKMSQVSDIMSHNVDKLKKLNNIS